jgi:quercetin dioxygenase-like cupin family protein
MDPTRLEELLQRPPMWSAGHVAFWNVGSQGPNRLWLGRFDAESVGGQSPWERHPDGEELLHVLKGAVRVTLLAESGPARVRLDTGSVLVIPRGVWHSHEPLAETIEFGATPGRSEHSTAADPRTGGQA